MRLIFVHGWSVTNTNTYGDLPAALASAASQHGLDLQVNHIHLGKYISFHDEVTLDDIARAFDFALRELDAGGSEIATFSCITHSTGGPVVRYWIEKYYGARKLAELPLQHLVMLAPANHGSSLAVIGKKRIGRLKAWFDDVEPGQRVLDWLQLGSAGQWQLNEAWLGYRSPQNGFYPFVLTGQGIDTKFYDFLNSYLVENGSDGVVRVAGANMNYRFLSLHQTDEPVGNGKATRLAHKKQPLRSSPAMPLGVFHQFSHSGRKMGILAVSRRQSAHQHIVSAVLDCLLVQSARDYQQMATRLEALTVAEQQKSPRGKDKPVDRYCMLAIRIRDQYGNVLPDQDFDVLLLGGSDYRPDQLPKGFYMDRQLNTKNDCLVFYLSHDAMVTLKNGLFGLRVVARPEKGFAYFAPAEFRSEGIAAEQVFTANQTTYIDITMNRKVDKHVFRFSDVKSQPDNFKSTKPSGQPVD